MTPNNLVDIFFLIWVTYSCTVTVTDAVHVSVVLIWDQSSSLPDSSGSDWNAPVVLIRCVLLQVLGVILSSIMIHQMRYRAVHQRTTVVLSVPTIFSPAPPKYQELHNPPAY